MGGDEVGEVLTRPVVVGHVQMVVGMHDRVMVMGLGHRRLASLVLEISDPARGVSRSADGLVSV
jgi:hypothetical protein